MLFARSNFPSKHIIVSAARGRILILPGAGITHSNIAKVAEQTGAIEFHAGLGAILPYSTRDFAAFESEVRQLAEQFRRAE